MTLHAEHIAVLKAALAPLAAIAKAYLESGLNEHRPEWGHKAFSKIELLAGRGGKPLLTLFDAMRAREALLAIELIEEQEQWPTVGDTLKVVYKGAWYSGKIIKDEDATWQVALETISVEPFKTVTVWKAASGSWSK